MLSWNGISTSYFIILVTKLSPVQATGEGNIAHAKRGERAQFLLKESTLVI